MATGIIKTVTDKGFGFIQMEGSDDVFFHNTACNGQFESLTVGTPVTFTLEQGDKGPKATNVVAGGASPKGDDSASVPEGADTLAA